MVLLNAIGAVTTQTFDSNGNRIRWRDALGNGEDCTYDLRNREILCTDTRISGGVDAVAVGDVRSTIYDANNNLISSIDANHKQSSSNHGHAKDELPKRFTAIGFI